MMSSTLLNPQLIIYSAALGTHALLVRLGSCFLCGVTAGILLRCFYRGKPFFNFSGFGEPRNRDTDPSLPVRLLKTIGVPLYACSGGTIPLLMDWLHNGMRMGAAAFMITGSATKIINLGAVKIVLGIRRFWLYLSFAMLFP